jgi:hypothetical protein
MKRRLATACLISLTAFLAAHGAAAQDAGTVYPASLPPPSHPTGFMIEGMLAQQIYAIPSLSSMTVLNALAVPNAIIGFKLKPLAIGLGVALYRGYYSHVDLASDVKTRNGYTSIMFMPRIEITVYRSKHGIAEVYLPVAFGVGFHLNRDRMDGPGVNDDHTESDVVLGSHVGLGARVFLGGSPFAIGTEFGWSGSWIHVKDWYNSDEEEWSGVHGIYGAINGTFVFD